MNLCKLQMERATERQPLESVKGLAANRLTECILAFSDKAANLTAQSVATTSACCVLPYCGGGLGFRSLGADGESEAGPPRIWRQFDDKSDRVLVPKDRLRRAKQLLVPASGGIRKLCSETQNLTKGQTALSRYK